jgi:DNA-binding winged helix-turn-helix (wHTH) protein/tetratricopeptide (TPR) repeat protein
MNAALEDGFRIGEFDIFPLQGRIAGPESETRVQPKIADVLLHLASTPGEVVSREELHDKVWGNVIVTDDALNRCISELRRKLGDKGKPAKYIETVPKRGYRLLAEITPLSAEQKWNSEDQPNADNRPPRLETAIATIAVMPFENLTPDSTNAFLADAIPTALHCGLARLNRIRVSSRRSSFALRDSEAPASELGAILGAQYIVSGSVAEAGKRIRVIAEVDDAEAGVLLWSHRYEVASNDVLSFEEQLTEAVVGAFGGQRLRSEISHAQEAPASKLDAWGMVQKARAYLVGYQTSALKEARLLVADAADKDPDYAFAHAMNALLIAENVINGLSDDPAADSSAAHVAATRALKLAPTDPSVLRTSGCALAYCGDYTEALKILRRAVKAAPFDLGAWGYMGWPLMASGANADIDELLGICDRLLDTASSHPGAPYWEYHKSVALACKGEWEAALEPLETCLATQPEFTHGLLHYANVLGELGRNEDAKLAVEKSLDANDALTTECYARIIDQLTDQVNVREQRTCGLRKAGLLT